MMVHFSKWANDPTTRQVIRQNKIGAVISAWNGKIYGLGNGSPRYAQLGEQISAASGLTLHIHPVFCRYSRDGYPPYALAYNQYEKVMAIVDRYADVAKRWTLSCELLLAPPIIRAEMAAFYQSIAERHPGLELWVGDYGIYDRNRRRRLLKALAKLKQDCPQLKGFIGQDYVDLDASDDLIARTLKATALGAAPLTKFRYLVGLIEAVQALGLSFALEHSTFSDIDTPQRRKTQQSIYNCLAKLCDRTGSEFWLWDCCDASAKYFHDPKRKIYAGLWDEEGRLKVL